MPGQLHKVGRQIIDAEMISSEDDGLALQKRLSVFCRDRLLPALEQALDRCAVPDLTVRIDRLEVDAGTLALERVEEDLAASVERGLEQTLRQELEKVNRSGGPPGNLRIVSARESLEEAFVHFLRTGRLPWAFRLPEGKNLEKCLTETWLPASGHEPDPGSALREVLKLRVGRERLGRQFSPAFVATLMKFPGLGDLGPGSLSSETESRGKVPPNPSSVHTGRGASGGQVDEVTGGGPGAQPGEEEGLYVSNAGLVLLHPFLPQCFGALGIVREDELLLPERALSLLHYLATGQTAPPEYELTLPKALLAIPLDEPVQADVTLTQPELEEADALLRAVIRHWDALRNTGPDGLRGAFLTRPGKLSLRFGGDWLLHVEQQAHDILLEQLPWVLAVVRLPWMRTELHVEWSSGL